MARIKFPTELANELEKFLPDTYGGPRKIAIRVELACKAWLQDQRYAERQRELADQAGPREKGDEPVPPDTP